MGISKVLILLSGLPKRGPRLEKRVKIFYKKRFDFLAVSLKGGIPGVRRVVVFFLRVK